MTWMMETKAVTKAVTTTMYKSTSDALPRGLGCYVVYFVLEGDAASRVEMLLPQHSPSCHQLELKDSGHNHHEVDFNYFKTFLCHHPR